MTLNDENNPRTAEPKEGTLGLVLDARRALKQGAGAIAERQRARLREIVAFARARSPYYRELYRDLPEGVGDVTLLPVTSKKALMARFDDWATDRAVTLAEVRAFVDDPARIGEKFLGKYTAVTTSGTTGTQGIFVLDDRTFAVTSAMAFRMLSDWLDARDFVRVVTRGARMAMVNATGGHFASAVAAARLEKRGRRVRVFPVRMPLPEMVAGLNAFRPVLLAPYASMGALLASEQEAGRLHIDPVLVVLSAEGLPERERERIARAFGAKVRDSYAATECPFLSSRCAHGWLHVNSDWVVLEPVNAERRPVPPGTESHTVLVTNLANRVQPILRYDLGDSVVLRPDPCPCGNPLPAIRVRGRAADVLTFPTPEGKQVTLAPLVFATLLDRVPGVELVQVAQTAPTTLRVRLRTAAGVDPGEVWRAVEGELMGLLAERSLAHVALERAEEPPERTRGGKYRTAIPLADASRA